MKWEEERLLLSFHEPASLRLMRTKQLREELNLKKNNFPFVSEIILYTNKSIFSDFDFRKSTYDNSVITFDRKRIKSTKT